MVLITVNIINPCTHAQTPYITNLKKDGMLIGSGVVLMGIGSYFYLNATPLTEAEINDLSKEDINPFDRPAISNWSPCADKSSDILLVTFAVLPASLFLAKDTRDDFGIISTLYAETYLFAASMNFLTKGLTKRIRPYAYNPNVGMEEKTKAKARRSFYSGHTTGAFAGAVLTAKIYSDYYPDSKWRPVVWGSSLLAASTVAYLRYEAGMHYPTDTLVGALMGSLTGYLIPSIHKNISSLGVSPSYEAKQFKISLTYRF